MTTELHAPQQEVLVAEETRTLVGNAPFLRDVADEGIIQVRRERVGSNASLRYAGCWGRAMVRTAEDAIRDFLDCGIDELYMEGIHIVRGI